MTEKKCYLSSDQIKQLLDHNGGCIATDKITVEGRLVGYMYREPPDNDADTGWRFMAGDESEEYMDDADNHGVYALNTIANYDPEIIDLLRSPIGSAFAREGKDNSFISVESPVDPEDCLHPDFPVVTGSYRLDAEWCVYLPLNFNHRVEDKSLILWRPGITLYFSLFNNNNAESIETRIAHFREAMSPDAFEFQEAIEDETSRFSYRLVEEDTQAIYGFVFNDEGHLMTSFYFDNEEDYDLVQEIFETVDLVES